MKKRIVNTKERKGGVALIMSVGILALLAMIATSFAINMQLEYKAATNQLNYTKAAALAEAGIEKAIAELIQDAKTNFTYNADSVNSGTYSDITLNYGLGSYEVKIEDEQRKVNINYANKTLLKGLLDGDDSKAQAIIDYRKDRLNLPPENPFKTIEEVKPVLGNDDAAYKVIEEYITVNSYCDPNTINDAGADESRCPVNINTADEKVLKAVIAGISDGPNTISTAEANTVVNDLKSARPFSSWIEFKERLDDLAGKDNIKLAEATLIMNNCNPNRTKPSTYTTDFCFFSGGNYALTSTGKVFSSTGQTEANKLAEKKIKVIVRIYGILNQTKKSQFQGKDGEEEPVAFKVNTYDSCPVESIDSTNSWEKNSSYTQVSDSIKNGFWDNMDDTWDADGAMFYVNGSWRECDNLHNNRMNDLLGTIIDGDKYSIENEDNDKVYKDNELVFKPLNLGWWVESISKNSPSAPIVMLGGNPSKASPPDDLIWDNFAWRSAVSDGLPTNRKLRDNPTFDYQPYMVMTQMSRWYPSQSVEEARMKQEFKGPEDDTTTGTFEAKVAGIGLSQPTFEDAYYLVNTLITVEAGIGGNYFYAYGPYNGMPGFYLYAYDKNLKSGRTSGQVGWWVGGAQIEPGIRSWADNVRIIPGSDNPETAPYFESTAMATSPVKNVTWGIIAATVTLSAGASTDSEKVYFQTRSDDGATWAPVAYPGVLPGAAIASLPSSSIRYRAHFKTSDTPGSGLGKEPYYSETIALEDITITYLLPSVEVVYFANVSTD